MKTLMIKKLNIEGKTIDFEYGGDGDYAGRITKVKSDIKVTRPISMPIPAAPKP